MWCASRLTSGVRIVPQTIEMMNATAALLIASDCRLGPPGVPLCGPARQHPVPQRQHVHARLEVAVERLRRVRHDGLVLVEARVEHERHARLALELRDERVV